MKTILVDITGADATLKVLKTAVTLAEQSDAHLVGLYVEHTRLAMTGLYSWGSVYTYPIVDEVEEKHRDTAKEIFADTLAYTGLTHEFRDVDMEGISPLDAVIAQSRLSDLFITGAETGWNDDPNGQADSLSQIIEGAGRPVLIIPEHMPEKVNLKQAVIAWDGSKEASRAAFDAIPVLKSYESVEIVSVNVDPADQEVRRVSIARLTDSLGRHGIEASFRVIPGDGSDRKALLKLSESADLIVMGAYHHNRVRELIFGGVTRGFLKTVPCPILFSR